MNASAQREPRSVLMLNRAVLAQLDYSLTDVVNVIEQAFRALGNGASDNPPKTVIEAVESRSVAYSMSGRDGASGTVGFKIAYEFDPSRKRNAYQLHTFMFLCDEATGDPVALMDVTLLDPLRTLATTAVLAREAAPAHARTALVVGSGVQAQAALPLLITVLPRLERLIVHGHYKEGLHAVRTSVRRRHPERDVEISCDLESSARQADVIIGVAGVGVKESVRHAWVKPGAVAILIGYGVDADVLHGADYRIATDETQMRVTCGDLANAEGYVPPMDAQLPDILLGRTPARLSDDQIVFAYNSGMVITDIALGRALTEQARRQGLGEQVFLW